MKILYLILFLILGNVVESLCNGNSIGESKWGKEKRALYVKNQRKKKLLKACNEKFGMELEKVTSKLTKEKEDLQKIYWLKRETALSENKRYQELLKKMESVSNKKELNELVIEKHNIESAMVNSETLKNIREEFKGLEAIIKSKTREVYKSDPTCSNLKLH